jgi:hypothetical protein
MMKTILITGLDGSGKTTVFDKLKQTASPKTGFLHVPFFQLDCIPLDFEYRELCRRINQMGEQADELQLPLLKIYALFASMVLFPKIELALELSGKDLVFAERHPLVDASLYALVYRSYMNPTKFEDAVFEQTDHYFGSELKAVLDLIPHHSPEHSDKPAKTLLELIYTEFGKETPVMEHVSHFFNCQLPDEIYFLDAPAAVLIERIGNRTTKEYHEDEEKLSFLRNAYLQALTVLPNVTIVSAERFEDLDLFVEKLKINLIV